MEIRFTPSVDDALRLQRTVSMPGWGLFLFILLLSLLFLVGVFLIDHDFAAIGWMWLALSAAIGIATYEIPRFRVRRSFGSTPSAKGEFCFKLTGEGTEVVFAMGRSQRDWRAYTTYKETAAFFLLYTSPSQYSWIPKRAMSPQQIEELRSLLGDRVTGTSDSKPISQANA